MFVNEEEFQLLLKACMLIFLVLVSAVHFFGFRQCSTYLASVVLSCGLRWCSGLHCWCFCWLLIVIFNVKFDGLICWVESKCCWFLVSAVHAAADVMYLNL